MLKLDNLDVRQVVKYIEKLVNIPSPTGFTHKMAEYLIDNAKTKNINFYVTKKGAVIYKFESNKDQAETSLLAAHVDTLGAIIKNIKDNKIELDTIGGYPALYIVGDYCKIHTFDDKIIEGTILPKNPSAHGNKRLKDIKLQLEDLYVRCDIKLEENEKLEDYVQIGNFISFDPKFSNRNGFINSRHLDDKSQAAILLYTADVLKNIPDLSQNVYIYFNITEETMQGISCIPKEVDNLLILDMGLVADNINGDEYSASICVKDSTGPYNYHLTQKLIKLAKENNIKHHAAVFTHYGSDGSVALLSAHDLKVGLIGPGVSASHGYERTHIDGLLNTTKLLMAFLNE